MRLAAPRRRGPVSGIVRTVDLAALELRARAYVDARIAELRTDLLFVIKGVADFARSHDEERAAVSTERARRRASIPEVAPDELVTLRARIDRIDLDLTRAQMWIAEHVREHSKAPPRGP